MAQSRIELQFYSHGNPSFDSDDAKAPSGRFFGLRQSVFSVFKITNLDYDR
jgi:hypothetical protein